MNKSIWRQYLRTKIDYMELKNIFNQEKIYEKLIKEDLPTHKHQQDSMNTQPKKKQKRKSSGVAYVSILFIV